MGASTPAASASTVRLPPPLRGEDPNPFTGLLQTAVDTLKVCIKTMTATSKSRLVEGEEENLAVARVIEMTEELGKAVAVIKQPTYIYPSRSKQSAPTLAAPTSDSEHQYNATTTFESRRRNELFSMELIDVDEENDDAADEQSQWVLPGGIARSTQGSRIRPSAKPIKWPPTTQYRSQALPSEEVARSAQPTLSASSTFARLCAQPSLDDLSAQHIVTVQHDIMAETTPQQDLPSREVARSAQPTQATLAASQKRKYDL